MARYSSSPVFAGLVVAVLAIGAVHAAENQAPRFPGQQLSGEFNVSLDHFRPQNREQVTFRYDYDLGHYDAGGPLFIFINDADTYTTEYIRSGLMYDIARELAGGLITADMRFFRFNLPTETVSFADLSLLSVEQSLADIVALAQAVRQELGSANSKAYVFGAGWGGTLAVLARQKYPSIFDGAWSSSGIFEPAVFTSDNYDILTSHVFEHGGDPCGMALHHAIHHLEHMLMHGNSGPIEREFGLCRPWNISDTMDVALFTESLLQQIIDHIDEKHYPGLVSMCDALLAIPADPFAALGRWVRFTYQADFGNCFNYDYAGRARWLADPLHHNPGTATGNRQFLYLQCMQLGLHRISQPESMFTFRVPHEYRQRTCEDAFGEDYDFEQLAVNVERFRTHYGGKNPHVTRAIFSNGQLDSWLSRGITSYNGAQSYVFNTPGYGKAGDLKSASVHDSTIMARTKASIRTFVRRWVLSV